MTEKERKKREKEKEKDLKVLAAKEKLKALGHICKAPKKGMCRVDLDPKKAQAKADLLKGHQTTLPSEVILELDPEFHENPTCPQFAAKMKYSERVNAHSKELSEEDQRLNEEFDKVRFDCTLLEDGFMEEILKDSDETIQLIALSEEERCLRIAKAFTGVVEAPFKENPLDAPELGGHEELKYAVKQLSEGYLKKVGAHVKDGE